jgi:hypothetical protein
MMFFSWEEKEKKRGKTTTNNNSIILFGHMSLRVEENITEYLERR